MKILDYVLRIPFDIPISINQQKLYANNLNRILAIILWKLSLLEKNEIIFVKKIVKKNMNVIDIGSNIGLYTLLFSLLVGDKGKVYSFEPEPNNFRLLNKSLNINQIKNVILSNIAISDQKGSSNFNVSSINSGDNRLNSKSFYHYDITVNKDKLDNVLLNSPKIDFIKIDIQGGEFDAFQGMKNIIKLNKKLIILAEFDIKIIKHGNISLFKFIDFLKTNFPFVYVYSHKLIKLEYLNLLEVLDKNNYKNLIFATEKIYM